MMRGDGLPTGEPPGSPGPDRALCSLSYGQRPNDTPARATIEPPVYATADGKPWPSEGPPAHHPFALAMEDYAPRLPPDVEPMEPIMHHEIPDLPDGPNRSLPPLNPFLARSTIALALTVLSALLPLLGEGGLATFVADLVANEAAIQTWAENAIRTTDAVIAVGAPLWFWFERRAPWRRLSFRAY